MPQRRKRQKNTAAGYCPRPCGLQQCSSVRSILGYDFGHVGDDLVDVPVLQLALLEGVVGLHGALGVEDDGHVGVLGDLVLFGAGGIVDRQDAALGAFLLSQVLELRFELLGFVVQENDEAAHLGLGVLVGRFIDLLNELGNGGVNVAGENHGDRVLPILANH